jgi:hypothetical protein
MRDAPQAICHTARLQRDASDPVKVFRTIVG